MTDVVSLELCRELYELSGWWKGTEDWYPFGKQHGNIEPTRRFGLYDETVGLNSVPAYSLGYLIRKLPPVIQDPDDMIFKHIQLWINGDYTVHIAYVEPYDTDFRGAYTKISDTAESAVAQLAIELFKLGILTKES